jgi:hypothetical protein
MESGKKRSAGGQVRILDLGLWLGGARLREHQLEALMEREDLSPEQQARVLCLLQKLRSKIRARLDHINAEGPSCRL